jgi:hypothetical protein
MLRGYRQMEGLGDAAAEKPAVHEDPGMTYSYGPGTQVLAANASEQVQFSILNHDFEADFLVSSQTGPFKCQIQVGSRFLSNLPMANSNHFGTAQNPLPLLSPLQLKKNDIVILTLTDTSGAVNTIDIALIGRELS